MSTGFVWHELYAWHDPGTAAAWFPPDRLLEPGQHLDSADCKRRMRNLLDVSGLLANLVPLEVRPATGEELLRLHTPGYLERLQAMSASGGGDAGELSTFGKDGYEIAKLAVGGCLVAVEAVLDGVVDNAYALVRPCGHHVEADRGRGHGILANIALAVLHARASRGVERIAVIDWDVHHGNGTETAFYDDADVLTISIHQDSAFPAGRGLVSDVGRGGGAGANINVPLPPGCGIDAYRDAMDRVVVPAVRGHRPQLIVVASGLDANQLDPNGRMMLSSEAYRMLAAATMAVADETAEGRIVMCHEGGYAPAYVPFCGLALLEQLSGVCTGVEDPFLEAVRAADRGHLPHQVAAVDLVLETHPRFAGR